LDYLGRNDDQIKLRGFRIELGEIEAALRTCHGVEDALVLTHPDHVGAPRLVAYVAAAQSETTAIRTQLRALLPDYMQPATYVLLDALPLTSSGKVDRRALPAPHEAGFAQAPYEAPDGPLEQALATLWRELLGIERVSRHDSFFDLGGHSLLAVRLAAAIRRTLHCDLSIQRLFAQPTLQQMAHLVLSMRLAQLQRDTAASLFSKAQLER
ncbi:phosphopantetheine-binding protein, partial [Xanthomonas albilineans]